MERVIMVADKGDALKQAGERLPAVLKADLSEMSLADLGQLLALATIARYSLGQARRKLLKELDQRGYVPLTVREEAVPLDKIAEWQGMILRETGGQHG